MLLPRSPFFRLEAFYLSFLIAPVLKRDFRKSPLRTLLIHWALFFGIAGAVLMFRYLAGRSTFFFSMITGSLREILFKSFEACVFGLWTCLRWNFYDRNCQRDRGFNLDDCDNGRVRSYYRGAIVVAQA